MTLTYTSGYTKNPDGSRQPIVTAATARAQIQPIATGELALVESLNIQGVHRRMYVDGSVDAIVRAKSEGGTLVTRANSDIYKVTDVPENWQDAGSPNWTCAVITLQNN